MSQEIAVSATQDVHDERVAVTRLIRDRLTQNLDNLLATYFPSRPLEPNETGEKEGYVVDVESIDKLSKLLLKSLSDTDKTELTLKRMQVDQAMNEDNIRATQMASESILKQLGRMAGHPLGATDDVIEGEYVEVSDAARDARLGITELAEYQSTDFNPGMLIKGRVEESSDAFYQRMTTLTNDALKTGIAAAEEASEE